MVRTVKDWREEINDIDAELISLLQRRMELAVELLELLRSEEVSLGDPHRDLQRLGILLSSEWEGNWPALDESAIRKIFRRIINEATRLSGSGAHDIPDTEKTLSPRERQVLLMIAQDNSVKQISLKLRLSVKTVESHRAAIMRKLQIHSAVGLTRYAIAKGLVSL